MVHEDNLRKRTSENIHTQDTYFDTLIEDDTVPPVIQPFVKMHYAITLPLCDSLFSVALRKKEDIKVICFYFNVKTVKSSCYRSKHRKYASNFLKDNENLHLVTATYTIKMKVVFVFVSQVIFKL